MIALLLERRHLTGARVTIGSQTKIAKCILVRGADHLLALKANQKSLATEVALVFGAPERAARCTRPPTPTTEGS